ncbi:MAG TPA: hypothetical protein VD738_08280 [Nitrospira sp.]|jgi:hypothetical protein|nr:hypothetical protein [Nitrospira sp.]
MEITRAVLSAGALVLFLAGSTSADTPASTPDPSAMWECQQADGHTVYTNKERAGCRAMELKPLSVVPSMEHMPTIPPTMTAAAPHYGAVPYRDSAAGAGGRNIPDWARDWHANNTSTGSVQEEVCGLYMEWLTLAQKTRGGFWFGSDPSYGGDLSGLNQRGPSYSFYDNARWKALSRIFGTGFVPVGCP